MSWSIHFNINPILLTLIFIASFIFSFLYYKITIPPLNLIKKFILIAIRTLILTLIITLILELTVSFLSINSFTPKTYIFVDNSKSISKMDSAESTNKVMNILKLVSNNKLDNFDIFTFGESIHRIDPNNFFYNPVEKFTNFKNIADRIKSAGDSINNAIIISDGNINNGSTSIDNFKELNIPIFTFGLSKKTNKNDIIIKDVSYNSFIYRNKTIEIKAVLFNDGFQNRKIRCRLYENKKLISEKDVVLSASNIDEVTFNYTPIEAGKKNLSVQTNILPDEVNRLNNQFNFQVDVIEDKLIIAFISSVPSSDFSIIKLACSSDTNRILFNYFIEDDNKTEKNNIALEKADIFFLVGFPSSNSSYSDASRVLNLISEKKKPFFLLVNNYTEFEKLSSLNKILPYSLKPTDGRVISKSILFNNSASSFINKNNVAENAFWNNLPPINMYNFTINLESNSTVLATTSDKGKNPLMIIGNKNGIKSFSLLGFDIWRWVLQNSDISKQYFSNFFDNIIKWLNASDIDDKFKVKPIKPFYYENEEIIFQAELYDDKFIPVENAQINLQVQDSSNHLKTVFDYKENGLYEARINSIFKGKVIYSAEVKNEYDKNLSASGSIKIEPIEIESINTGLNDNLLKNLSFATGGEYIDFINLKNTLKKLEEANSHVIKSFTSTNEIELRDNAIILIVLIILLLIEWLIRKLNYLN